MNCEVAREGIVAAAYGELPDEQQHELERHMTSCPDCTKEEEQVLALKVLADAYPVREPDANLVARSRLRLEEALDALPPARWYERLARKIGTNLTSLQAAPAAVLLLLVVGAGAGYLGGYQRAQKQAAHAAQEAQASLAQDGVEQTAPAEIANISSIERQPENGIVEVRYNQLVPQRMQRSLEDPAIQQLLMLASENAASPGVRDHSVELLAAECRSGRGGKPAGIRDALMVALRYDKSAQVREKALEGLQSYVADDTRVRDAVLDALLNDSDPQIRTTAINILEPVEADTSVRQVLYTVSTSDENPQIRTVSRQVLSRVPEIQ